MDGIGSALITQVRARVDADEQLDVEAGLLVLAAAAIAATLAVESGRQPLVVRREWPPGSDLADGVDSVGGTQGDNTRAALGWDEAITAYRPFLPYNELGSIPERRPADLYDTMLAALGLDALVDARGRNRTGRRG